MTYAKHVALAMQPFYQHQLGQQMRSAAASIPQQATAAAAPLSISLVARHCAHTEAFQKERKEEGSVILVREHFRRPWRFVGMPSLQCSTFPFQFQSQPDP